MDFSHKFTNHGDLLNTIDHWMGNRRENSHRFLLIVTTLTPLWLEKLAHLGNFDYVSHESGADRSDRIAALLGSERSSAVVTLAPKPDLGLIAAVAGTIKAGGLMVLGINPSRSSHSLRRLLSLAEQLATEHSACVAQVIAAPDPLSTVGTSFSASRPILDEGYNSTASKPALEPRLINPDALAEQNALLSSAIKHVGSRHNSCVAITGTRGRGKSTLLARLAKHFANNNTPIAVTTQNKSALGSWAQHAPLAGQWFIAPEKAATQSGTLLFVDEAANFPLATIQRFLDNFSHVILASTIDGYESGGRALDIRLLSDQSQSNSDFLQLEPQEPWRWSAHDPLETLISRLLLNQTIEPSKICGEPPKSAEFQIKRISQQELAGNEALLASVYSLLKATHYQTSTKDLEHLLDATSLQVWAQMQFTGGCQRAVAVLLLEIEGEIENKHDLHEDIVSKTRRLPNQLLPQLLAQSANTPMALHKRYGRVLRIAVAPEHRRCHLATELLRSVIAEAQLDAFGASFASDERSNAFWQACGFQTFHRGFKDNPRTGQRAIAVLRSFEATTKAVMDTAVRIYKDNENSDKHDGQAISSFDDIALLQRFVLGQRSMHDSRSAIRRLPVVNTLPLERTSSQSRKQHELLLRKCVEKAMKRK